MFNILKSFIYSVLRLLLNASLSFSYRNIIVSGYDKIRNKKPILFVSNHQNTFMDGLVLVKVAKNISPNILVRADIFKSKWAAIALDIIHLIPIYRKKDNMGSVAQNNEIFKKCFDLFKEGKSLLVFPEGNHAIQRFLRKLQKGPARIAFQAEEENHFQLGLTVAPFGLHYENHPERWYDLHMHFADPFQVAEFKNTYKEDPVAAQKAFNEKIRTDISGEMVDIKWHSEYEFMEQVRTLIKPYAMNLAENNKSIVHAESELVNKIGESISANTDKTRSLKQKIRKYFVKVKEENLTKNFSADRIDGLGFLLKAIGVLIGFPFWLLAKVINFIPEYLLEKKVIARVKDITWHISLRTGISMFLYPIYYLFVFLIMASVADWVLAGIVVSTFPLISVVMYETEYNFRKLKNAFILFRNPEILKIEKELVQELRSLL